MKTIFRLFHHRAMYLETARRMIWLGVGRLTELVEIFEVKVG